MMTFVGLNSRSTVARPEALQRSHTSKSSTSSVSRSFSRENTYTPPLTPSSAHTSAYTTMSAMLGKMNRRQKPGSVGSITSEKRMMRGGKMRSDSVASSVSAHSRARSMTGSLRALKLQEMRVTPTF